MENFINKNKTAIIIGAVVIIGLIILSVMGGGATGTVSDNAKLDQSKKVESTVSNDQLSNGAVKMGNIGNVQGGIDLSKHNTTSENNSKNE